MSDLNSYEESLAIDLAKAEARIKELERERDGYLAERNNFEFYLQRTHADLELEVAAVDALAAKLDKAVKALQEWDALIQHQYTGSRDAMSDMTYIAQHTADLLAELTSEGNQ